MTDMEKLDDLKMESVTGGINVSGEQVWKWVKASISSGYLSLVSDPDSGIGSEIKKIVDGTAFRILPDKIIGKFVYAVFDGKEGWVDTDGIVGFKHRS